MLDLSPTASGALNADQIYFLQASRPGRQGSAELPPAGPPGCVPWLGVRASGTPRPEFKSQLCNLALWFLLWGPEQFDLSEPLSPHV